MNTLINQLSDNVSNTYTAAGDGVGGADKYHVDASGVRTLGQRYGEAMIGALGVDQ